MKKILLLIILASIVNFASAKRNPTGAFVYLNGFEGSIAKRQMPTDTNVIDVRNLEDKSILGLNFIKQGLDNSISAEYVNFKEKYGVGLINEGCVIEPFSISNMVKNNKKVAAYLDKKYGKGWIDSLTEKPAGL